MKSDLLKEIQKYLFVPLRCNDDILYSLTKGYYGYNEEVIFNMVSMEYSKAIDMEYCTVIYYVNQDVGFSVELILNSDSINPYNMFVSAMKSNFTMV